MGSQITDRKVITRGRLVPGESNVHSSRLHHTKGGARQVESSPFHCPSEGHVCVSVCVWSVLLFYYSLGGRKDQKFVLEGPCPCLQRKVCVYLFILTLVYSFFPLPGLRPFPQMLSLFLLRLECNKPLWRRDQASTFLVCFANRKVSSPFQDAAFLRHSLLQGCKVLAVHFGC